MYLGLTIHILKNCILNCIKYNYLLLGAAPTDPRFKELELLHYFSNYNACKCLVMKTLNPTRYSLLISKWMESGDVMTPVDINRIEPFILG